MRRRSVQVRLDGLLVVEVDGKKGFIDLSGRIVIAPTFDFAWQFSEGRASAWLNGRAGFIDTTGTFVIPPKFEYARAFHEGLAEVELDRKWGFVGTDGSFAVQPQFEDVRWFSEGLAMVRVHDLWGYIDKSGSMVISPQYRQATPFKHGRAWVQSEKEWIAVGPDGRLVDTDELIPRERDGKWGFVSVRGDVKIGFRFENALSFSEGRAPVRIGGHWGFIDTVGRVVVAPKYDDPWIGRLQSRQLIGPFIEGLAPAYKDARLRYIDASGHRDPAHHEYPTSRTASPRCAGLARAVTSIGRTRIWMSVMSSITEGSDARVCRTAIPVVALRYSTRQRGTPGERRSDSACLRPTFPISRGASYDRPTTGVLKRDRHRLPFCASFRCG